VSEAIEFTEPTGEDADLWWSGPGWYYPDFMDDWAGPFQTEQLALEARAIELEREAESRVETVSWGDVADVETESVVLTDEETEDGCEEEGESEDEGVEKEDEQEESGRRSHQGS
jgi:hypothetical protein